QYSQAEVLKDYGVEWDRVLLTTLGVANNRLYELRMQTAKLLQQCLLCCCQPGLVVWGHWHHGSIDLLSSTVKLQHGQAALDLQE
ncbi:PsbP domain-containing protein, partial [Haematococcus lacustris]